MIKFITLFLIGVASCSAVGTLVALPSSLNFVLSSTNVAGWQDAEQTIELNCSGCVGATSMTAAVTTSPGNAMTISPSSGSSTYPYYYEITVHVNSTGMSNGSYSGSFTVSSSGLTNLVVAVNVTVQTAQPTATLEDWSSLRTTITNAAPLWAYCYGQAWNFAQVPTFSNGSGRTDISGCTNTDNCGTFQERPVGCNGVGGPDQRFSTFYWIWPWPGNRDGSSVPSGFAPYWLEEGGWSSIYNRFNSTVTCDTDWPEDTASWIKFYIGFPANGNGGFAGSNGYYNNFVQGAHANRTMHFFYNLMSQAYASEGPAINLPLDWDFFFNWQEIGITGTTPSHKWNGLMNARTNLYGGGSPALTDRRCFFSPFIWSTTLNEPEEFISSAQWQYTGTAYNVSWAGPWLNVTNYDVKYSSAGSLHTNGFSTGTSGGTQTSSGSTSTNMEWTSSAMAEAANMWIGIRPRPSVIGATNTSPIIISTPMDLGIPTGAQVTVAGACAASACGNTNVNGTWTVSFLPRVLWSSEAGTTATTNGSALTVTTPTAHGMTVGQVVQTYQNSGAKEVLYITSIPTSTKFVLNTASAFCATPSNNCSYWSMPAYSLTGSTGNGTFVTDVVNGSGTVVATDDHNYFTEFYLAKQAAPSQSSASGATISGGSVR